MMEYLKELSKNNEHYISKHRQYELQHFCMQYKEWVEKHNNLVGLKSTCIFKTKVQSSDIPDPTALIAERIAAYDNNIKMVSDLCHDTDPAIGKYIFLGVTKGLSYDKLNAKYDIPCCKEYYYKKWHEFFWRLSDARN